MRSPKSLSAALAASALLAACPSEKVEEVPPLSLDEYTRQYDLAFADKLTECSPAASSIYWSLASSQRNDISRDLLERSVAAGRLAFHPDKGSACLQAIRALTCGEVKDPSTAEASFAACEGIFEARVAPGGDCILGEECIDSFCDREASCPGKCVVYADENESCAAVFCHPYEGLYCDLSGETLCHKRKAVGADCDNLGECQSLRCLDGKCVVIETEPAPANLGEQCGKCVEGLYCDRSANVDPHGDGVCAATLTSGAECGTYAGTAKSQCGETMACAGYVEADAFAGVAGRPGACAAWADVGGACTVIPEGATGGTGCKAGLSCRQDACVVPPTSGPCLVGETFECDTRVAWCDENDQCVAKLAEGAVCKRDEECWTGGCHGGTCTSEYICRE